MKNYMSYDILILSIFSLVAVLYAFKQGFNIGQRVYKDKEIKLPKIELPTKENRVKKKEEKEEKIRKETAERLLQIEIENIENYGTSVPQREIK